LRNALSSHPSRLWAVLCLVRSAGMKLRQAVGQLGKSSPLSLLP